MSKPNISLTGFTLKLVKPVSNIVKRPKTHKVSRLCLCTVIKDVDNPDEFRARIPLNNEPGFEGQDYLVIKFTENTLSLDNKEYLFSKKKDKTKHYVLLHRNGEDKFFNSPYVERYNSLRPDLVLLGWVIKKDGQLLFEMKDVYSFFPDKDPIVFCHADLTQNLFPKDEDN